MSPRLLPLLLTAALATPLPAAAQPAMPDLRSMAGRPLPVPDLAPGTVVVRLARKLPANPAANLEVTAAIKAPSGDSRTRTAVSGPDGRATFEGIAPGSEFEASVTIDGERLTTSRFPVPQTGGTRVMLIGGLPPPGAAPPAGDPHAGAAPAGEPFRVGAPTGQVMPAADLPAGTLELELLDPEGRPLANHMVRLGEINLAQGDPGGSGQVQVHDARTDASGKVRYTKLTTGETAGYAAVSDYQGARISTIPFRMAADSGMRGKILALDRTRDLSALRFDPQQSRMVVDLREEALAIMISFVVRNGSRAVFDNGDEGLFIPLPEGAVNAQEIEGGETIEILPGKGVRLKAPIPPDAGAQFATQIRYGYILPAEGARSLAVKQVLPIGLSDPLLIVPGKTGLSLEGEGLKTLRPDVDGRGDKVDLYTLPAVAAGGALGFTVHGIPGHDRSGRSIAGALCLALIGGAIFLAGGRRKTTADGPSADSLVDKREHIFAELVEIEKQRKAQGPNPRLDERRKETVARLEAVYRDLARIE